MALGLAAEPTVAAPISAAELQTEQQAGASRAEAEENLVIQHRGTEVNVPEQLEDRLGDDFGGVWFDNDAGEFVVPVATAGEARAVTEGAREEVAEEFGASELPGDFRTEVVAFSHSELEAAQSAINERLAPYFEEQLAQTEIDPEVNAVVVRVPEGMAEETLGAIENAIRDVSVNVEVRELPRSAFELAPDGCEEVERWCDLPVRGGTRMYGTPTWLGPNGEELEEICTVGFRANGLDGKKYILTAGHCPLGGPNGPLWNWKTVSSQGNHIPLGTMSQWHYPGKDWAKIDATGSEAEAVGWPTILAYWGGPYEYPIFGEARSYIGQTLCHIGSKSGTSCGIVKAENVTVEYSGGYKMNSMFEVGGTGLCSEGGDSGGPFFANNVALGILSGSNNICYSTSTRVYFSDIMEAAAELNVNVAGPGAPEALTGSYSSVQPYQATVAGQVNPRGLQTSYQFEYGLGSYSSSIPAASAGAGQGFVPTSATLTGLEPLATYQYRIRATNSLNTTFGLQGSFTTPPAPPKVSAVSAEPGKLSATLRATIDGVKSDTSYRFEYGPTTGYGSSVPIPDQEVGAGVTQVSQSISGVEGNYHYRVVATNAGGTTASADQTFFVQPRPLATTEAPTEGTATGARLNGTVNPQGATSTYFFEYGLTTAYGSKTATASAGAGTSGVKVNANVSGLEIGTTYHYRLVAENWAGTRLGPDLQFMPGWEKASFPYPETGVNTKPKAISCSSATSCVAAGAQLNSSSVPSNLVDRWNGTSWTAETLTPAASGSSKSQLEDVSCVSSSFCAAVGAATVSSSGRPEATIWNGTKWTPQVLPGAKTTGFGTTAMAVACTSASFCIAGGGWSQLAEGKISGEPYGAIWNGSSWSAKVPTKPSTEGLSNASSWISGISCTSSSNCWAVGSLTYMVGLVFQEHAFVERWNGSAWSAVTMLSESSPTFQAGASTISCGSSSDCTLVGTYQKEAFEPGNFQYVQHWDGSKWSLSSIPVPAPAIRPTGLSCTGQGSCLAIGAAGGVTYTVKMKGGTWEAQSPVSPTTTATDANGGLDSYYDLSCVSETACVAIGRIGAQGEAKHPFTATYIKPSGVPPAGPVAAFAFNEGSGSTTKDVAGTHTGTIAWPQWVEGKYGKALQFNGDGECVTVPNSADLQLNGPLTLSAWVMPFNTTQRAPVIFKEATGFYGYSLFYGALEHSGYVQGYIADKVESGAEVESPSKLTANTWANVAMTSDGTTLRLYINGTQVDSGPAVKAMESKGPLQIGCSSMWTEYFEGKIDNVRIYSRPLTQAEIEADKNTGI
ncbi:MAG TPA: LamG-like jellyroll fold domain-containing protein [Solirubrobacterales bacterium]|nr:LamG-like jellyroll fold domain-containing protein [Solirubrobacterales bacterium]